MLRRRRSDLRQERGDQLRSGVRRFFEKRVVIDGRCFIGVVGNRADDDKIDSVHVAHLRDAAAFHLAGAGAEFVADSFQTFAVADELVAGCDDADVDFLFPAEVLGGLRRQLRKDFRGRDDDEVEPADEPFFVPDGGSVHVVLDKTARNDDVADVDSVADSAGNADVDDGGRRVAQNHRLRADGGGDFSDAAFCHNAVFSPNFADMVHDAADGFAAFFRHPGENFFHFHIHCADNSRHSRTTPRPILAISTDFC